MYKRIQHVLGWFFLPSKEGAFPLGTSRESFFVYYLVFLLLLSPILVFRYPFASLMEPFAVFTSADVISLLNESRVGFGLSTLKEEPMLARAAEAKARDMLNRQYFSHTTPEGKEPWIFLEQEKYLYSAAGENLAVDFLTARSAHDAFMASPGHKANILNSKYREIGVAVISGDFQGKRSTIIVQFFGSPRTIPVTAVSARTAIAHAIVITAPSSQISQVLSQATTRLVVGSRGVEVSRLQKMLSEDELIYPEGAITGYFGELTKNAVIRFQKKHGIVQTGVFGSITQTKFREIYGDRIAEEQRATTLGRSIELEIPEAAQKLRGHMAAIVVGAVVLFIALLPLIFLLFRKRIPIFAMFLRFTMLIALFFVLVWTSREENLPKLSFPAFSGMVIVDE